MQHMPLLHMLLQRDIFLSFERDKEMIDTM